MARYFQFTTASGRHGSLGVWPASAVFGLVRRASSGGGLWKAEQGGCKSGPTSEPRICRNSSDIWPNLGQHLRSSLRLGQNVLGFGQMLANVSQHRYKSAALGRVWADAGRGFEPHSCDFGQIWTDSAESGPMSSARPRCARLFQQVCTTFSEENEELGTARGRCHRVGRLSIADPGHHAHKSPSQLAAPLYSAQKRGGDQTGRVGNHIGTLSGIPIRGTFWSHVTRAVPDPDPNRPDLAPAGRTLVRGAVPKKLTMTPTR